MPDFLDKNAKKMTALSPKNHLTGKVGSDFLTIL